MNRPSPLPWHADPREFDRWLDGEGTPAEIEARARDVAADPDLARRASQRRAFLALLAAAAPAPTVERAFESRIRAALEAAALEAAAPGSDAGPRRPRWARPALAAAALLLLGLGVAAVVGRSRPAEALHPVDMAARLLTWQPRAADGPEGLEGCSGRDVLSFPLVQRGELLVKRCAPTPEGAEDGASAAVLTRPEELSVVGYLAVPAPGSVGVSEIGVTELERGRIVVLDVLDHGRRVYLAIDAGTLRRKAGDRLDNWTCAACHGPERQAQANPHRIVLRRAP